MTPLNVPGTALTVRGCDIYGKSGRIRKPGKRDCFTFQLPTAAADMPHVGNWCGALSMPSTHEK